VSSAPGYCAKTINPVVSLPAHSATLGLIFYNGTELPARYRGGIFVAYHGSSYRSQLTGYKVVFIPMHGTKAGTPHDVVTGWLLAGGGSVWGRPVELLVAADGSLLTSDDDVGVVYRLATAGRKDTGTEGHMSPRLSVGGADPMNEAVQTALNRQIKHEFSSAHFYLSASGYCESISLTGFAGWLRQQSREEVGHALRIFDFMHDRGSRAELQALDQPGRDFVSLLDVFTQALQHEQAVTASINEIYALAVREQDYPTQVLLQWFITEQVEEEKSVSQILEELRMVGDSSSALLMLQRELGTRRAVAPMPAAAS